MNSEKVASNANAIMMLRPIHRFAVFAAFLVGGSTNSALGYTSSTVQVQVEQTLPQGVTPTHAKKAWLSHHWLRSGRLPVLIEEENGSSRQIWPIGMKERLLQDENEKDDVVEIHYKVSKMGLFGFDLDEGSHHASVRFVPDNSSNNTITTTMFWNVEFAAARRAKFWKAVTESNLRAASANLATILAAVPPRHYRRVTFLPPVSTDDLAKKWVDFVWYQGGGLPIAPPIRLNSRQRYIPPYLIEQLVQVTEDEIRYQVNNPSWLTFPVYSYEGRVRFKAIPGAIQMIWEAEARPLPGAGGLIESFASAVISTLARNFKVHLAEPGATVKLLPGGFGEVSKDSWLGGVLEVRAADQCSLWQQTMSLMKPWTWGRITDEAGEGEEWTDGYMLD